MSFPQNYDNTRQSSVLGETKLIALVSSFPSVFNLFILVHVKVIVTSHVASRNCQLCLVSDLYKILYRSLVWCYNNRPILIEDTLIYAVNYTSTTTSKLRPSIHQMHLQLQSRRKSFFESICQRYYTICINIYIY